MRVRAIAPGFFDINKNGHPVDIRAGQVFEVPDDHPPAKWFAPVDPAKPAEQKPPAEQKVGPKAGKTEPTK